MNALIAIIGIVLSILSTIAIFILSGIKNTQADTNKEIKEMNKDIREVLVSIGKSDEKIVAVTSKVDMLHDNLRSLSERVVYLEQK